jgi:hypothetical protein
MPCIEAFVARHPTRVPLQASVSNFSSLPELDDYFPKYQMSTGNATSKPWSIGPSSVIFVIKRNATNIDGHKV